MGGCESAPDALSTERVQSSACPLTGKEGTDCPITGDAGAPGGQVTIQQASDDRGQFVRFIKNASADDQSPEFAELRMFLTRCFVDCDTDFDGLIGPSDFDKLVERAGALPRKWGFAPTTAEMFSNDISKNAFRLKTFKDIDTAGVGSFALDEWLSWAIKHIRVKAQYLSYATADSRINTNKEEFKEWIVAACRSRHCPEYKELYHFLQDCFMKADKDTTGFITADKFDTLIELAAEAPRRFDFAPKTEDMFASDEARKESRGVLFKEIHAKNKRGMDGQISFNAWLDWAYVHICVKAKEIDPTLTGIPPKIEDLTNANYGGAKARSKLSAHRGISAELANDNKEMFIKFVKAAAASKDSPEYEELHYYLMESFVECDQDFDGLIREQDFDNLVERAGALPRKWGFAPTTQEMFKTDKDKVAFRKKTFSEVNKSKNGTIHFDEWLDWSYAHVQAKAELLDKDAQSKMETNVGDFKKWVIAAAKSRESPEYKELYHFLHDCFMRSDDAKTGLVDAVGFDRMIELAASAPRRFGLAPPTNKTYPKDEDRIRERQAIFDAIASRNRRSFRDKIPFQSWLQWAYAHICAKAKDLDPSMSGVPPGEAVPEKAAPSPKSTKKK